MIAAGDLAAAAESDTNEGILPARAINGYVFAAIPASVGVPAELRIGNNAFFGTPFNQQAAEIDDALGEAHIVIVTAAVQISALAGQRVELRF